MRARAPYNLPADKEEKLRRAVRLEWWTIGLMTLVIVMIGFVTGSSQAMKTAWVEDMLSLVPPISFLVAYHFQHKPPDDRFPYGYRRAIQIAFLCAALALTAFGGYLLIESALALIHREHPTIGMIELFGQKLWLGWLMILALAVSAVPPVILGRLKLPLARETHAKVLQADADMNRADWMTALAGIFGIFGLGFGFWWADATAAGIISLDIVRDGLRHLKDSVTDLMDEVPRTVEKGEIEDLPERLRAELEKLAWVRAIDVRLREEGNVFTGEIYIVPVDETDLITRIEQATKLANDFEWRIYDMTVTPVRSLDAEG